MHPLLRAAWTAAGWAANTGVALAPAGGGKLARTFAMRRGAVERLQRWASAHRQPARPLVWVHAPSVGEGLMARPVLEALRTAHPDWQVAFTHFSPSAERFARGLVPALADVADVLPFDTPRDMRACLDALRPSVLCFAKLDVWPVLVAEAVARGVRVALVSATVPEGSGRLRPLARAFLGDAYRALSAVGAVDAASAERLVRMGATATVVSVTGDTRYDQVLARVAGMGATASTASSAPATPWGMRFPDDRPTVVAGSTWPSDEAPLVAAWRQVRRTHPEARLIIAPHEPTEAHLGPLARAAREAGWTVARLGEAEAATADVVLVDRVGVLAELYAVSRVALVGGGFHDAGLHSVVEPAALGVPVVCGPRDASQRDAALLAAEGALVRVASAEALAAQLVLWLEAPARAAAAGAAARHVVEREAGAGARSARLVEQLVTGAAAPPRPVTPPGASAESRER